MDGISRRQVMGAGVSVLVAGLAPGIAGSAEPAKRKPNIILIISDDQGSVDVNCYGAKDLITPNLDALAAAGVRFTQFYATAAVCSASRASILTGRYPQRAGLTGNAASQPGGTGGLPPSQITMAKMLKAAGYATGHVGKWHMGYTPANSPNAHGFDYSFGFMGGCLDNYSHFYFWNGPNRHDLWQNGKEVWHEGEFLGDLTARECCQFIEKNKEQPFFLCWAINEPHYPLQPKAKWREAYKNVPGTRGMYGAYVSTMDELIGQVLAKVDELGLRDDTIIIFQSDQGHSYEDRTFGGGGSSGPYRGGKTGFFEGGVRIPAMIAWRGHLPAGQVRGQVATGADWMPTVAELTGAKLPERKIDGASIVQVVKSADAPSPHSVWHWAEGKQWAVRDGDWKLLVNGIDPSLKQAREGEKAMLVNLAEDPGEKKNLAKEKPEIVTRLTALHEEWAKEVDKQ